MFPRRQLVCAFAMLVIIAAPRPAAAQWWEFIGEMSGPAVMGGTGGCKIDLTRGNGWQGCKDKHIGPITIGPRLFEDSRKRTPVGTWPRLDDWPRLWLSLEAGAFFSYGNTPEDVQAYMGVAETMLEARWCPSDSWCGGPRFVLYHGSGFAYHHMIGDEFRPIQKGAPRFRPLVGKFLFGKGWELTVAWNVRAFWDRFTQDELTSSPAAVNRPYELVNSISAGLTF